MIKPGKPCLLMILLQFVAYHCYRETTLLLRTTVVLANLINALRTLWFVVE